LSACGEDWLLSAPVLDEKTNLDASSASLVFDRLIQQERTARLRNGASLVLFVSACSVWISSFFRLGVNLEGLPWYLAIGSLAILSVRFLRSESSLGQLAGMPRTREPLKLKESLALCFMVLAVTLYSSVGYRLLHPPVEPAGLKQVVDIQLLSPSDYKDNHEDLPGTQPQDDLKQRTADQVSQQGDLQQLKALQKKAEVKVDKPNKIVALAKPKQSSGKADVEREDTKSADKPSSPAAVDNNQVVPMAVPILMPKSWQTKTISQDFVQAAARSGAPAQSHAESEPFIAEVTPPEMVELVENDGDKDALHVFQKGGKSNNGKGAENGLSTFLKELHKRIKNAWAPPAGKTRAVEVLFRLKRDGHLSFCKITKSSGTAEIDASATRAIMAAASNNALVLPKDYTPNYLDISYTFKYNVNELQEVSSQNLQ
jgi:outer membrane biosynthesis protein TonB